MLARECPCPPVLLTTTAVMPSPTKRSSHDSRGHSFSQHHAQPPTYWSEQAHDAYDYDDDDEAVRRPTSKAPLSLIPGGLDSSRAIANGGEAQANGAGVGAGRNAYLAPDTPSMYTDPYEYSSTVVGGSKRPAGANVVSTRPDANFLAHDPYGGGPTQGGGLERSNTVGTLGPGDSISAYNVNAVSRNMGDAGGPRQQPSMSYDAERYQTGPYSYGGHQGPDESRDFYDPSYHGHGGYEASYPDHGAYEGSRDDIPLRNYPGGMGYADDGYNDAKQRDAYWNGDEREHNEQKNPPSLFANNLQDPPLPRKSVEDGGEDRKGLLGALPWASKEGTRAGWGGTLEDQIERRRKGVGRQRWPILTWLLAIAYVVVFIVELIKAKAQTGQAIQTSPSWNPMLGPSFEFLISFGARFVPCMRVVPDIPTSTELACLQYSTASSLTTDQQCPIWELCGLPDASTTGQAYRFVTPIFLHAGFIHIGFNLLVQLTLCAQIEKLLSTPFYAIIYMAGGIGGNLLGGNFGLVGQPSVGASGAIYTCISLELVDLCYNWRYVSGKSARICRGAHCLWPTQEYRPRMRLFVSIVFAIIGFAIGLLPGLDNFAHIGGFAVGLLGGALFCPSIHETRKHRIITWVLRIVAAGLLIGFCECRWESRGTGISHAFPCSCWLGHKLLFQRGPKQGVHLVSLPQLVRRRARSVLRFLLTYPLLAAVCPPFRSARATD